MHSKQLQWYLGIISWSRSCHPGVSSSQGSPLRFPQIVSFREDPPTGAALWRDWPCCIWGSISLGMASATLLGKQWPLPSLPHPQILRRKQENPASLQAWTPLLSPRTAQPSQTRICVCFAFQKSFSGSWTVGCFILFICLPKPPFHFIDSACST